MTRKVCRSPAWPEGVREEIEGYAKPLFTVLDNSAAVYPDKTYTIFQGAKRTYRQVKGSADRIASFLVTRGVRHGDRVAIFLPNLPHYPEIFFGVLKAGGICVTCNPMYTPAELNFQLRDSGAVALFVMDHPVFYPGATEAMEGTEIKTVVICNVRTHLPFLKGFTGAILGRIPKAAHHHPGHCVFDEIMEKASVKAPDVRINPSEDTALILYSGGTTGVPKGACLSHANLMSNLISLYEWIRISEKPGDPPAKVTKGGVHTGLGVLPWYHSFGLTLGMLFTCYTASRLVCIPDPRAGKPPFTEVLKAIEKYRATTISGVPTLYSAFVNHPLVDNFDLSSIIGCGSGGAALPVEVLRKFEEKTGSIIFEGYGLTETSPVLTMNPADRDTRKIGSVGLPLPGTDLRIIDLGDGAIEKPRGEDGEIAVSGPQVMLGYWNAPEADSEVFSEIDGKKFFMTGDIGHVDEEGFVFITDRKKDLIIVGGFNVFPREIEEVLYTHPKVALAAVVGIPSAHSGEKVKAFIQLKQGVDATEEEFREFLMRKVAGYKRPAEIEFRKSLPTSIIGKVLRRVLREEELGKIQEA